MYVQYEHASGYVLVHCDQTDDINQMDVSDWGEFGQICKLTAFKPFTSAANALDNMNAISEGLVHEDLKAFLSSNLPSGQTVGIVDPKLLQVVKEEVGCKVQGGEVVQEVCRGIRLHMNKFVKALEEKKENMAQLGLGHSYSRSKVKFNVNRSDNMVIQAIALIDQLDKDINTFAMRVREWYGYHFPELVKLVNDNYQYCQLVKLIKNRKCLTAVTDEMLEGMEKIVMDSAKSQAICDCARASMGMDISDFDLINIEIFANKVISLADYRKKLQGYLSDKMGAVAPSLASLIGDVVGARLISHAGSLTKLAKYPASTVQILGAEKALFRALKTRGNTPKYGLLFHSTFIGRATAKNKGRISRFLANKCTIASRIDAFSETPNTIFGEKLKDQVEERLKLYEDGTVPKKNLDVMKEAIAAVNAANEAGDKRKAEDGDDGEPVKKKKKKKKNPQVELLGPEALKKERPDEPQSRDRERSDRDRNDRERSDRDRGDRSSRTERKESRRDDRDRRESDRKSRRNRSRSRSEDRKRAKRSRSRERKRSRDRKERKRRSRSRDR
jgi:nucleolar protein 56